MFLKCGIIYIYIHITTMKTIIMTIVLVIVTTVITIIVIYLLSSYSKIIHKH